MRKGLWTLATVRRWLPALDSGSLPLWGFDLWCCPSGVSPLLCPAAQTCNCCPSGVPTQLCLSLPDSFPCGLGLQPLSRGRCPSGVSTRIGLHNPGACSRTVLLSRANDSAYALLAEQGPTGPGLPSLPPLGQEIGSGRDFESRAVSLDCRPRLMDLACGRRLGGLWSLPSGFDRWCCPSGVSP